MDWTDAQAADEARLGNRHAFRVLVERHSSALFRLAFLMTRNEQDAEDVVQETFLRSFKQLHTFDGARASFGTWLHRICANCSLNLLRSRKTRLEKSLLRNSDESHNLLDQAVSSSPSPERLAHSHQIATLVGPALDSLSDAERTAFVLRHFEGCGIEEIASTLGTHAGAAKQTVFRAVQKLRVALEPAWGLKK